MGPFDMRKVCHNQLRYIQLNPNHNTNATAKCKLSCRTTFVIVCCYWIRPVCFSHVDCQSFCGVDFCDEPCALPLSPPKGDSKTRIFTFGVAFYFFVAGNRRHFKYGMCVEHSIVSEMGVATSRDPFLPARR